jgi:hypothetical protein
LDDKIEAFGIVVVNCVWKREEKKTLKEDERSSCSETIYKTKRRAMQVDRYGSEKSFNE